MYVIEILPVSKITSFKTICIFVTTQFHCIYHLCTFLEINMILLEVKPGLSVCRMVGLSVFHAPVGALAPVFICRSLGAFP